MRLDKQEELGRGAFGSVFRGVDESGDQYALKIFDPTDTIAQHVDIVQLKKRFRREVLYQHALDHPNIVEIVSYDLNADPPYFVMPLAVSTLQDDLEFGRTNLEGRLPTVLFDILSGLEHLHNKGYTHRDLKPRNILKFEDRDGTCKYAISDFGLLSVGDTETTTLTATDQGGGTQLYAPPELLKSFKAATPKADIYSFGAILHDIFVGGSRIPYSELKADGQIGQIINKCTKTNSRRRYENIAALRQELFQYLDNEPIQFTSDKVASVVSVLQSSDDLNDEQWDNLFEAIDTMRSDNQEPHLIFKALTLAHINNLHESSEELFAAMGEEFSDYVREGAFDFNYCDVLLNKVSLFYQMGAMPLKVYCLIALMVMGVSHNRWVVESAFMSRCDKNMDSNLADRFLVELDTRNIDLEYHIGHIEGSIDTNRELLHPKLKKALKNN